MITKYTKNIFDEQGDAVCVTTNGIVKANGEAVMGAGIAKEANRYNLARELGTRLRAGGNHCYMIGRSDKAIFMTLLRLIRVNILCCGIMSATSLKSHTTTILHMLRAI